MIAVKDAVASAAAFARELLDADRASQLLVEEVEATSAGGSDVWVITLSIPQLNPFGLLSQGRDYKTFTVDGQTGKVLSMKIRQLVDAG